MLSHSMNVSPPETRISNPVQKRPCVRDSSIFCYCDLLFSRDTLDNRLEICYACLFSEATDSLGSLAFSEPPVCTETFADNTVLVVPNNSPASDLGDDEELHQDTEFWLSPLSSRKYPYEHYYGVDIDEM
jgi:hypothetical protein